MERERYGMVQNVEPLLSLCRGTKQFCQKAGSMFVDFILSGSTPGGSIAGSITEKRPSNPFVLQGQGVQLGDIPSTICSGDHQINQMGSDALPRLSRTTPANSVPFTEMTNPGSSQVPFRAEMSIGSEAPFKR